MVIFGRKLAFSEGLRRKLLVFTALFASIGVLPAQEPGFDETYWAAQPPQIRVLKNLNEPALSTAAKDAADKGFLVDVPIHVWKWRPWLVMTLREQSGLTWVPSANQPPLNLAGDALKFGFAGRTYEPNNPPPGSIRVSTKQSDYPPFDPPPPPVVQAPVGLPVGHWTGLLNRYYCNPAGIAMPDGARIMQDGATFVKRVVPNVIGTFHFFEKQ